MKVTAHPQYQKLGLLVSDALSQDPRARNALQGCEMLIGPAGHPDYSPTESGVHAPSYVGDSWHMADAPIASAETQAIFQMDPNSVTPSTRYNGNTRKFEVVFSKKVHDSVDDSLNGPLVGQQALAPSAISWIPTIFKRPLIWSAAQKLVKVLGGTDPWAEVMSLQLADFAGFASLPTAGGADNQMTSDVESVSGVMSAPVINITVSYKLTIEEVQRAQSSSASPFSGQIIALKQQYANWAIDMITNYLIYWGNAATGTIGLFTVNGTSAWSGSSLTVIKNGASTTKGSDAYVALANVVAQFLTNNYNMVHKVRIAMSTLAYNIFASLPWSAGYNPASALKAMVENFLSGEGKTGAAPDIEIIPDALLSPSTIFNSNATDYLVISAPEIDQNIDGVEPQALLAFGAPLMDFVYPVIPGQYNTGYKTLRRIGGIFAPYTPAVQVFTGFGV